MMNDKTDLENSNPLLVPVVPGLTLDAGSWTEKSVQGEIERLIIPPRQPLYRQVIDYLDAQPQPEDFPYLKVHDEAVAIYGLCVRYGSYFAVLADSSKPVANSGRGAGITDGEMKRLNIEISAALAYFIDLRRSDISHFRRILATALTVLPLAHACDPVDRHLGAVLYILSNEKPFAELPQVEQFLGSAHAQRQRDEVAIHPTRILANVLVNTAWRNNEIENQHAHGGPYLLRQRRISPRQEIRIRRASIGPFRETLWAIDALVCQKRPWPEAVLPFHLLPDIKPTGWSLVDQTCPVTLFGTEDDL